MLLFLFPVPVAHPSPQHGAALPPEQVKDAVPCVSKCSVCFSTRFFRELTELKTFANYSTCDRSNLADWLGGIDPKFRQYTYNLLTCGIDRNFLHRVTEQQLQEDCHIHTGFHRVRILTAARGAAPGGREGC